MREVEPTHAFLLKSRHDVTILLKEPKMQIKTKQSGIFAAMILLMAITRGSHFGSSSYLPDATLAVFLVAGFMLPRFTWVALAAFMLLLLEAGGIDYYAIAYRGVSDYCVTPAYWFLIPTYAGMWLAGSWYASHQRNNWNSWLLFGGISWVATSTAFVISNAAFYLYSGRFSDMPVAIYASSVAKYYPSYLAGSLMYLAMALAVHALMIRLNKPVFNLTQH